MSVNRMTLVGRLGADPELRETKAGTAVVNLSVATDRGGDSDAVDWHRATAWDRTAEVCAEYLEKGSRVYLAGPLQYRTWTDDEGRERKTAELQFRKLEMLDGRRTDTPTRAEAGATAGDGSDLPF